MKIGFLHQPNDPYTFTRIKYFLSKGHDVISISFPKSNQKQKPINKLKIVCLPNLFFNKIFLLKRVMYIWHIYKITKINKIDILHVVNAESMILSLLSKSKRVVVENQGSDVLLTPNKYPWVKVLYKFLYKFVDAVIQDSKVAQDAGIRLGAPIKFNEVINIGIDFNVFHEKIELGVARNKLKIGDKKFVFSSRGMKSLYNIDTIIKSIPTVKKHFPDVQFVFASTYGDFSEDINIIINKHNLTENILFTGWLNHENEMPYYNKDADIVVSIPSSDSSPFSVYEAMATKTPVVASDLPWIDDNFEKGKDLLTVKIRDEKDLSEKIIAVLKNKDLLNVNSAYDIVLQKINMEVENAKLEHLFYTLLK